jgi:hypothetical protein
VVHLLPPYLQKERHFPASKMAVWGAAAFLTASISSLVSGWLSDLWISHGGTPTRVRKTFTGAGLTLATIIIPVSAIHDDTLAMVFLLTSCVFIGMWSSNNWAVSQTLAGPHAAGKWCAIQNGVGNLSGVTAPWFTGWVVGQTGHFFIAFLVASVIALAGAGMYVLGVGPVKPVVFAPRHQKA